VKIFNLLDFFLREVRQIDENLQESRLLDNANPPSDCRWCRSANWSLNLGRISSVASRFGVEGRPCLNSASGGWHANQVIKGQLLGEDRRGYAKKHCAIVGCFCYTKAVRGNMFNLDCWLEWEKGKFVQFFEAVSELSKSLEHSNTSGRWILARIYQISDEKHALIWDLGNSS